VITEREGLGVVAALQRATHATLHSLANALEPLGLTASEQNVLAALADGDVRAVGELAATTGTKPSTLTSVLDRLERRGDVEREAGRADRRSVLISLTGTGRRTASTVQRAITELETAALADVTAQQVAGFFAVAVALAEADR
jgi:MarR family transcriptional regulator, organic hydroperoxide resistance regulator